MPFAFIETSIHPKIRNDFVISTPVPQIEIPKNDLILIINNSLLDVLESYLVIKWNNQPQIVWSWSGPKGTTGVCSNRLIIVCFEQKNDVVMAIDVAVDIDPT